MDTVRVVIADDHAVVRDGIANTLKSLPGLKIVGEAGNGSALLAILAQTQPDCLLLDIGMPGFLPISDIHLIRSRYPDMKILVISAYDDDAYVQGMLAAGVNGYHLKDQPLEDLRLAVQRVLSGERWVCSPLVEKLIHSHDASGAAHLTERQRELLQYLQQGLDNQAIARLTCLSVKTVENHLTRLYRQLKVQSRLEAVAYIAQHPELLGNDAPEQEPTAAPSLDASTMLPSPYAILIVDDNLRYRAQLRRMISKAASQAKVYEAENTQAAMNVVKEVAPLIAFVNMTLSTENGIECTRQIRKQSQTTHVVLLSVYPDRLSHRLGLEAGAEAFVDKGDLNVTVLREIINDAIDTPA